MRATAQEPRKSRLLALIDSLAEPTGPAWFSREPGYRIATEVAGIRLDFVTESRPLRARLQEYFAEYEGQGPADATLRLEPHAEESLWEDPDPEFAIAGERVVQRDFVAKRVAPREAIALLSPGIDDSFHNLLRWFLPRLLLRRGAFLLHGAGLVRDGRGYVFFGQSGAGKSTTMEMIRGADPAAEVLGDDAIIIQVGQNGGAWVHSAPLGCGYTRAAPPARKAPLAGMFALQQAQRHALSELSVSEAVARLLASAMCVRFDDELEARLDLAWRFAAARPGVQCLEFKKDAGFWERIREGAKP